MDHPSIDNHLQKLFPIGQLKKAVKHKLNINEQLYLNAIYYCLTVCYEAIYRKIKIYIRIALERQQQQIYVYERILLKKKLKQTKQNHVLMIYFENKTDFNLFCASHFVASGLSIPRLEE